MAFIVASWCAIVRALDPGNFPDPGQDFEKPSIDINLLFFSRNFC